MSKSKKKQLQHRACSRRRRVSKPSSLSWLVHLSWLVTSISRGFTGRRVFLLNHDWFHPFGILSCRLLVYVLSNTSRKVIYLQIRMLLSEDGHDATIGMPESLVVLVVGFLLQVLDLNSVGIAERFELSLVHSLLPLKILFDLVQLFLEGNGFCLSKRFLLYQLQIFDIQLSYFFLGSVSSSHR